MEKTTYNILVILTLLVLNCIVLFGQDRCEFEKNELIIEFESSANKKDIHNKIKAYKGLAIDSVLNYNIYLVRFDSSQFPINIDIDSVRYVFNDFAVLVSHFDCDVVINGVGQSKPPKIKATDYNYNISTKPLNNSGFNNINLNNYKPTPLCEQNNLTEEFSISSSVTIAVLDAGFSYNYDRFIDIKNSYDFIDGDDTPYDGSVSLHGTNVTNIIQEILNGTTSDVSIIPIRILDRDGGGSLFTGIKGLAYAISTGADIVNMSFGTLICEMDICSNVFGSLLTKGRNTLFIAAAGNDGVDIDLSTNFHLPGSLNNRNLIKVGSSNCMDGVSSFSNIGKGNVHFFMSAEDVSGIGDELLTGTSFAAPQVAAYAVMATATDGLYKFDVATVKNAIFASVEDLGWYDKCKLHGVLNPNLLINNVINSKAKVLNSDHLLTTLPTKHTSLQGFFLSGGNFQINIASNIAEQAQINLYSLSGRLIKTEQQNLEKGETSLYWDRLTSLPSGIYLLQLQTANGVITQKCFKPKN